MELVALSVTGTITSRLFKDHGKLQHKSKLFYPSERPPLKIPVRGVYYETQGRTAGHVHARQFTDFQARKIPPHVAKRLFSNYKDDILPRFPCFSEEDLVTFFSQFYGEESLDPTPMSSFVVPMVLAISSLTSNSHEFPKVAALSESLHSNAMRHMDIIHHSSIQSLQCILLLIQLALLLPYSANLWYFTGEAMRMAVSLGLHQETDPSIVSDPNHVELRRRIFWVVSVHISIYLALIYEDFTHRYYQVYLFDRTVGISGGCPIALSNEHITTKLPYGGGDPHSLPEHLKLQGSPGLKHNQFLIHIRIRFVQSEIHSIQFFDQRLPDDAEDDYEAWVLKTNGLIQRLVTQVTEDGGGTPWLVSAIHQCQVLLRRPCSRNIAVSRASLLAAVGASTQLISLYMKLVQSGGLIMAFEIGNSAFHAGMVLLYALRNHGSELAESSLVRQGEESLGTLTQMLVRLLLPDPPFVCFGFF